MRHHIVTRIVVSLVVLFVAAVALFAWRVTRPAVPSGEAAPVARAEAATGKMLFSRHCATCHEPGEVGIAYREAPDLEAAGTEFREFLADHYGPSPDGIVLIVSYVIELDVR